jgi:hypothetical protein
MRQEAEMSLGTATTATPHQEFLRDHRGHCARHHARESDYCAERARTTCMTALILKLDLGMSATLKE